MKQTWLESDIGISIDSHASISLVKEFRTANEDLN